MHKKFPAEWMAKLERFGEAGEKTGWYYIHVSAETAGLLMPGMRKSFRVKGYLDEVPIEYVALVPMGGGDFILAVNAEMRKQLRKPVGATITVSLQVDTQKKNLDADLQESLKSEPDALACFQKLSPSHQLYFSKWIESAKTDETKARRIARTVDAMLRGWGYPEMSRYWKGKTD